MRTGLAALAVVLVVLVGVAVAAQGASVPLPGPYLRLPPGNAVVLFDGKDLSKWTSGGQPATWAVADGAMTVTHGYITSTETFQDAYVHLEFKIPYMPDARGQGRGNSGVFLQGRYEVQVLDSYGFEKPGKGDCGAVYAEHAPLVNACRPPLQWQSFDMIFRAPRFGADGKMTEKARLTVFQNGAIIQNNVEITPNGGGNPDLATPGPLSLQDHHCPVSYRNIWFVPLPAEGSDTYSPQ